MATVPWPPSTKIGVIRYFAEQNFGGGESVRLTMGPRKVELEDWEILRSLAGLGVHTVCLVASPAPLDPVAKGKEDKEGQVDDACPVDACPVVVTSPQPPVADDQAIPAISADTVEVVVMRMSGGLVGTLSWPRLAVVEAVQVWAEQLAGVQPGLRGASRTQLVLGGRTCYGSEELGNLVEHDDRLNFVLVVRRLPHFAGRAEELVQVHEVEEVYGASRVCKRLIPTRWVPIQAVPQDLDWAEPACEVREFEVDEEERILVGGHSSSSSSRPARWVSPETLAALPAEAAEDEEGSVDEEEAADTELHDRLHDYGCVRFYPCVLVKEFEVPDPMHPWHSGACKTFKTRWPTQELVRLEMVQEVEVMVSYMSGSNIGTYTFEPTDTFELLRSQVEATLGLGRASPSRLKLLLAGSSGDRPPLEWRERLGELADGDPSLCVVAVVRRGVAFAADEELAEAAADVAEPPREDTRQMRARTTVRFAP